MDSWGEGGGALDVVLVRAVRLQGSGGVGEVLVGYEHGESDAESESSHDEQKLQVGAGVDKRQHRKQHEEEIGAAVPETIADKGNSKKKQFERIGEGAGFVNEGQHAIKVKCSSDRRASVRQRSASNN